MRRATALAVLTLLAPAAQAADYLRGPLPEPAMRAAPSQAYDWSGFTVTVLGAHGTGKVDQTALGNEAVAAAFPSLAATSTIATMVNFGKPALRGNGFSVALGYNTMWDDVVLGVEGEYSRLSGTATSSFDPYGRALVVPGATSYHWDTVLGGSARTRLQDYGVVRTRVGAAFDRFLPYVTLGIAAARMHTTVSVSGQTQQFYDDLDPTTQLPRTTAVSGVITGAATSKTNTLTWGYALGLGMDVAITDNIFLRGQYEYIGFGGSNNATIGLNTFKGGAGLKF